MAYDIQLRLPEGWQQEMETYEDESGSEIVHLEAHLYNEARKQDEGYIDIYVGPLPEDTTAEDQALSNYADIVGFDDDDPEDFNPIATIKFNGKKAYGFEALAEDDSPMRMMSIELKKNILVILVVLAKDDDAPEDFNPIATIQFNGKQAYGFDAWFEDERPMMFLSQEVRSGILALIIAAGSDDAHLKETLSLIERNFRVR